MTTLALTLCLAIAAQASVEPSVETAIESGSLAIRVSGLRSDKGQGAFALYDSAESFHERREPLRKVFLPIVAGECEWRMTAVAAGEYVVAFYHDRNGNGQLDRNKLRFPREPYGFSNDARGVFGPPSFPEARFYFDGTVLNLEIRPH